MIEILLTIPERSTPIFEQRIEIELTRCKLESCQRLLQLGKEYCSDQHRWAFHNQAKKDRS